MYRAAVIGDRDSIYGFAALGLEVFPVTDSEMGSKTLRRLAEGEYAVIYITEALAAELEHELDHFRLQPLPAIIRICCIERPAAIVTSTKGRLSARASSVGVSSSSISAIIWGFTPRKMKSQMPATSSFVPQAQPSSSASACALAGVRLASSMNSAAAPTS